MNYHIGRLFLSSLCVGVFAAAGIWWCSLQSMNYHIGRLVLSSLCVGDLVRLVLGDARFAGFRLQNEHSRKLLMMDILMSETC